MHFIHKTNNSVPELQRKLMENCTAMNTDFKSRLWTDDEIRIILEEYYPQYVEKFYNLTPPMKRVDLSRYFLMHRYGGIYTDVDYQCLVPVRGLFSKLKRSAWVTGWPDPSVMISAKGMDFWIYAIDRVFEQPKSMQVWDTTGPSGLNRYVVEWIVDHGLSCVENVEGVNYGHLDHFQYEKVQRDANAKSGNKTVTDPKQKIGFVGLDKFDPCACERPCLNRCISDIVECMKKFPMAIFMHHCSNTWRNTPLNKQ